MSTRKSLEEWQDILIGNTYNLLTVEEVSIISNKITCICRCACGNIKLASPSRVFSGKLKSCGCLNNKENLSLRMKGWYNDNPDKAKEKSEKVSEWYKNNPDKAKEYASNHSKWCKENPDKLKERGKKISQWYKDNPEKVKEMSDKHKKWFIENPDKVKERSAKFSKWCKENPDKIKEMAEKISITKSNDHNIGNRIREYWRSHPDRLRDRGERLSQTYKDNPSVIESLSKSMSEWCKNNPDKIKIRSIKCKQTWSVNRQFNKGILKKAHIDKRIDSIKDVDLSSVHPDDLQLLNSGLRSDSYIRTRCPMCGEYCSHRIYHVISYRDHKFIPRLCDRCAKSFTSSKYEQEIADYISTFYNGELIKNNRSILNGKELDLYYPEKRIAIEFNGDYWHSENHRPRDYHYNKFKECLRRNIVLISVFESHWINNKDLIMSYICDTFNGISNSLSFNKDGYMNNNYPSPDCYIDINDYLEDYYCFKDVSLIYTCGYSKLCSSAF